MTRVKELGARARLGAWVVLFVIQNHAIILDPEFLVVSLGLPSGHK